MHGTAGNGTTHFLKQIAHHFAARFHVFFVGGRELDALPSAETFARRLEQFEHQDRALLLVDDADRLLIDYLSAVGGTPNSPAWYKQRECLLQTIDRVHQSTRDSRIVLTSNEATLWTDELRPFIEVVVHIPYKTQRERLLLLRQFTSKMRLCPSISLEATVKRLNGHVVRALRCVCERAAASAVLNGTATIEERFFAKAIQHVVFRQKIRPFVIRPKPNMQALRNPLVRK
ncbi:hypothetical protein M3Y99_00805200 [Aphelenchoides fujianensis]|nr:hypothetical protein M3Y99_00805200 [Aphelenchoides fujianensis]